MKNMIKSISLTAFLGFSATAALSGQSAYDGDYMILNTGDTLYGRVEHVNHKGVTPEFYKKIRLTNEKGKRKKYSRGDVESFRIDGDRYEGFWLNQSSDGFVLINPKYDIDRQNGEQHFLKAISQGSLSHYQLEWWDQGDAVINWTDLLIRENDTYFIRATQGVFGLKRKTLSEYFDDCPQLAEKIQLKELRLVAEVVEFFDIYCNH